jgi:leader peptidase (prepilin peptidase)/N-methyltransferase
LKGRCRYCQKPISWQYPAVELVTGIAYVTIYYFFGLHFASLYYGIIFSLLIITAVYDIRTQYVPESVVWLSLILAFLGSFFISQNWLNTLIGLLIGGGFLALFVIISREKWMGSGDIKIGSIMGILVGFPQVIPALFISFVLGSIVGLIYIYFAKKSLKAALPFATFLIVSTFLALLWGDKIINWYLGKLFF